MELKLTTKRALEFEERTGKDIMVFLQEVAQTGKIGVKDIVEIFCSLGEGYTVEVFDAWDATFTEKCEAIMKAIQEYVRGSRKKTAKK